METSAILSVEIDSDRIVLDLKEAIKVKAPALIWCSLHPIKLFIVKSVTSTTSKKDQQQDMRQLERKMLDGERVDESRARLELYREMKNDRRLDSFAGLGDCSLPDREHVHVIVQQSAAGGAHC